MEDHAGTTIEGSGTMKNRKFKLLLLSVVLFVSFFGEALPSKAVEGGDGQATRGGKIMFYEEAVIEPDPVIASSSEPGVVKPKGRLPRAGELFQKYGLVGGIILTVSFLLFFLRKRGKEVH